ncbi:hypothetical protein F2P56_011148 [Juglans regia]|uniref:Pentatricopeptide repeat-containing protein At3g20730-like n=1 Tax=Juglans regia TaxID=51240 RepID=A0A833XP55_JUGRE|nr:hypothetical protein F2P56_011148 [Juglans regia]
MAKLHETLKPILSIPFSRLDYSMYMKMLQVCMDAKAERCGRLIHNQLITSGFDSNVHLNTKLIIFYSKFGHMDTARNLFDKMRDRNLVSWTAMISGFTQNGYYENALMMFSAMRGVGVKANQFTYASVLKACTSMRCLEVGMQVHGCIHKSRFVDNLFVQSALVDLHSKCGEMEDACKCFEMMAERDVVSWNAMIGGYAVQGFADESFQMFRSMMREGLIPDGFTLGSVLRACATHSSLMKINQTHGLIIHLGFGSQNALIGSLIGAYAKCGRVGSAYHLYKSLPTKDIISCTSLIVGFAHEANHSGDALRLFKEVIQMHIEMDEVIFCSMLNICANISSLSFGRQVHAVVSKVQSCYDVAMGNALVDMYAKCGGIEDAKHAFDEMEEKNVISWTSLIAGYGKHGFGHKAFALYKMMEHEGLRPNDVTFLTLLFACSHSGLTGEGSECFNSMVKEYNILPKPEHLSCIIDLFARGGQLEEAYNLICEMKIKPTASIWGAILGASSTYYNLSIGEIAAINLFKMDPKNSVNYVVLASLYAACGQWDNASKMWNLVKDRGLKKDPGYSLLQATKKEIALLKHS